MNIYLDEAMANGIEAFTAATAVDERKAHALGLGELAHEIRNSAQAASLAFALVRKGQVGALGRTGDTVVRGLARIEALVQRALVEASLDGRAPVRREHINLAELLDHVAATVPPTRGVQVRLDVQPDLYVDADLALLSSAVGNLLQNAVKFTRDSQGVALRGTQNDRATTIEVEDRCDGLPQGLTEALFKPFVQGTPDPRGVGLGLHIARGAIEVQGGTVTVRDIPGIGCLFTITLPRAVVEPTAGESREGGQRAVPAAA